MIDKFLEVDIEKRIFGLDLLRTIAILLVLLHHGDFIVKKYNSEYNSIWIFDGVDLFFVLSGFLIGGILLKEINSKDGKINLGVFWKNRWYRTLPNYFLVLISLIFIQYFYFDNYQILNQVNKYFIFLQNFSYTNPSFFPESWSIAIEEWFYLSLPLLYILIFKLTKNQKKSFVYSAILLILISISYKSYQFSFDLSTFDQYFRKIVLARFDSLAIGVLAAYINFLNPYSFQKKKYISLCIGVLIVLLSYFFPKNQFYLVFNTLIYSIGIGFFLPFFSSLKTYPKVIGSIVLYISSISYSIYLFHFSIILFCIVGLNSLNQISLNESILYYNSYIFITLIISTLNYKFFELFFLKKR